MACLPVTSSSGMSLVLWLFLSWLQFAQGGYERDCDYYQPSTHLGICGRELADLLDTVCIIFYGGNRSHKRSAGDLLTRNTRSPKPWPEPNDLSDRSDYTESRDIHEDSNIFLPKEAAMAVLSKRGSYHGSITCECCHYKCNIREMGQYCSVPRAKKSANTWGNTLPQKTDHVKEKEDVEHKQSIGRMLSVHGPQWLENYFMFMESHDRTHTQHNNEHGAGFMG